MYMILGITLLYVILLYILINEHISYIYVVLICYMRIYIKSELLYVMP